MVKLTCWTLAITLFCSWCWPLYGNGSMYQYSSVRVHTSNEDIGKITLFILFVIVSEIGKRLDKEYICPVYCDIDHTHYFREKDEEKHEQEGNLQTVDGIHNTTGATGKKQSAGSI